jgi:threonine/homoserine/homoserine lactone efflux protein
MEELIYVIIFGLIVGLATSVPVGAMSLYCIKNTMDHSVKLGIVSGAAASLADLIYSIVAVFSLTWIQGWLTDYRVAIRMVGGCFIIALGVKIFKSIPLPGKQVEDTEKYSKCALYGFLMTISNPMTFVAFTFIFTTFGLSSHLVNIWSPYFLVMGVYLGSLLWWTTLALTIKYVKHRISQEFLVHINKGSACLLFLLGAGSIGSAILWMLGVL